MEPLCMNPLSYLQRNSVQQFEKGQAVYDEQDGPQNLYVLMLGLVKISRPAADGNTHTVDFVWPVSMFGESCLNSGLERREAAVAQTRVAVMAWSREEIEEQVLSESRLGIALFHAMARRCNVLQERLHAMAVHTIPERVLLALLQLGDQSCSPAEPNIMRILSLTHQSIGQYVGVAREVVTTHMNDLRRRGIVSYSRKHIEIDMGAIAQELHRYGMSLPPNLSADTAYRRGMAAATRFDEYLTVAADS